MAFTYKLQAPDGQLISFASEEQLTESQAQQQAAAIYDQRQAEQAALEQQASGWRNPLEFLGDTAIGLGKGALGLGATAGDVLSLFGETEAGMDIADKFRAGQEALGEMKSEEMQAREKMFQQELASMDEEGVSEGTKFANAVGSLITTPTLLLDMATEQVPQLLPIAKAGKGARALLSTALPKATEKTLSRAGIAGAASAAAVLQGSDIGMQTYDRVYDEYKRRGASDEEAAMVAIDEARQDALQAGLVTLGTTAMIPGAAAVEKALVGGATSARTAANELKKLARTRAATKGMLGEATQEGLEEGSGAYISNLSAIEAGADIDPFAGVGAQAGIGAALGGAFGLPAGIVQGNRDIREAAQQRVLDQAIADKEARDKAQAEREQMGVTVPVEGQLPLPGFETAGIPEGPPRPTTPADQGAQVEVDAGPAPQQIDMFPEPEPEPEKPDNWFPQVKDPQAKIDLIDSEIEAIDTDPAYADFSDKEKNQAKASLRRARKEAVAERQRLRRQAAVDAEKAKDSAFVDAEEDLFGIVPTQPEVVEEEVQGPPVPVSEAFGGPQQVLPMFETYNDNQFAEDVGVQLSQLGEYNRAGATFNKTRQDLVGLDLNTEQGRREARKVLERVANLQRPSKWQNLLAQNLERRITEAEQAASDAAQARIALQPFQGPEAQPTAKELMEDPTSEQYREATDYLDMFNNAQNVMRDPARAKQIDDAARKRFGGKAWGNLKSQYITKDAKKQIERLKAESMGRKPESGTRDMFVELGRQQKRDAKRTQKDFRADVRQAGEVVEATPEERQALRDALRADRDKLAAAPAKKARRKAQETIRQDRKEEFDTVEATPEEQAAIEAAVEADRVAAEQKAEIEAYNDKFNKAMKRSEKGKGAAKVMDGEYIYRGYHIQKSEDGAWNVGEIKDGNPASEFDDAADTLTDAKAIVDNYIEPEVVEDAEPAVRETEVGRRERRNDQQSASEPSVAMDERAVEPEPAPAEEPVAPEPRGVADTGGAAGRTTGGTGGKPASLETISAPFAAMFADNNYANAEALLDTAVEQKILSNKERDELRKLAAIGKKSRMGVVATVGQMVIDSNYFKGNPQDAKVFQRDFEALKSNFAIDQAAARIDAELEKDLREARELEQEPSEYLDDDAVFKRGAFEDNQFSTVAEIEKAAGKLIKRLRGTLDVKVVQSRSDLPAEINAPAGVKGVYHNGTAYIIADNVPVAEVQTVLAHETVGHAGLETILDKGAFRNLLNQINSIKNTNPRIKAVLENIKRMYTDPQGNYNLSEETEAREILAHIAEAKTELLTDNAIRRVWNNAVAMFRRAMARLGFIDPADATIDQLIHEAAMHMQGGKHINRDRLFMRHDYMAAHTMQRAWDMGFRGFDLDAAGAYVRGVANGSVQVPQLTEDTLFGQEIDHDFIDQAVFSRGEPAAPAQDVDQSTKDIIASRGRPQAAPTGMAANLREIIRGRGAVGAARRGIDYIRVMMFDSAATIEDKLMKSYNNAMAKDGFINPMVPYVQALRAEGMAMEVLRTGGLRVDENGLWEAVEIDGVSSMQDVYNELSALGKQIGPDNAQDLFHAVTIAQREIEIGENNAKNQAEADRIRAKGGKNAEANAKRVEDKIVNLHPGKDEAWQSARDAENKRIVAKFEQYPELRRAHNHFLSTKDALVDVLVDVGFFSKEKGADLKDAIGYVPFNRLLEDGQDTGYDAKSTGLMRVGSLGTLNGSVLEIDNILDNMTKKIVWMTQTAMRVRAANELIRGLSDEGVDGIQGFYDMEEQVPTSEKAGLITYYENGKMKFATTKDHLDAYAFRGNEAISLPLLRMLANATDWLRKGITLSPEFIIGQWQQDSIRAYAMGGTKNGLKTAAKVTGSYAKIRKNLWEGGFGDEQLNRYGIQGMYDATTEHNKELIDAQIDPTKSRGVFKKLLEFGEHNAEASDLAQRKAVYDQTMLETNDPVLAFWRASEVINFNRRGAGKTASVLRQLIPFQNAYFQGMSILLKSMLGRGLQQDQKAAIMPLFWSAMTKMFVLNFMYAMAMADDDEYQNQPDYVRSRYLQVPVGDGMNLKWAMPADLAILFKALPETIAMGLGDKADSKKMASFMGRSMYEAIAGPSALPQFAKPVIEAAFNESMFTDAPIISQGMANREVEDRYNESTSQFARLIGKLGVVSPIMVDHIVKGFTGTLGGTMLTVTDLGAEASLGIQRTDRELADYPIAKSLFTRTSPTGFKQDFYDLRRNMREVYGSYKAALERGDVERAMEIREEDPKLLQLRAQINKVDKIIKDSNARIKKIQARKMDSAEKRRLIDIERDTQSRLSAQIARMRRFAYD